MCAVISEGEGGRGGGLTDSSHCKEKKALFPAAVETGTNESVITESLADEWWVLIIPKHRDCVRHDCS